MSRAPAPETAPTSAQPRHLRLGLQAEPQLHDLAARVADRFPEDLARRFSDIEWRVEVAQGEPKNPHARIAELVRAARQAMLDRGWDLVICLTDIPLRSDGRPLTAHASATDGVALISVPALGAIDVESKLRDTALDVVAALVGEGAGEHGDGDRATRIRDRLRELASPLGTARVEDDDTIRFSGAVIRGNLRLLVGMVRANRPWRVAARLSKALVAAIGTAAYVLASTGFWTLADHMTWPRQLGLCAAALAIASVAMIWAHGLWERSSNPHTRERVVLFNAVTTLTIAIGVLTLYLGLLAFSMIGAFSLIPPGAFEAQTGRDPAAADYLNLAWLGASLATLAGALGSLIDGDLAVREAAYGYRPSATHARDDAAS
jgi:uncharacterized membrane protein